jgi:hypothetical protein
VQLQHQHRPIGMVKVGRARRRTATAASVEEPLAASASATAAATPVASAPTDSDGGAGGRSERPASKKGPRATSPRPNYFLSLRVNNQAIWDRAAVCQAKLLEKEPGLSRCIIPPNTMHLTLFVIHLADEAAVERARQLLVSNTVVYTPVHGHIPGALLIFVATGCHHPSRCCWGSLRCPSISEASAASAAEL